MGKEYKLTARVNEAQLFQLITFVNGFTSFNRDPGQDSFIQLMHILHDEAQRIAPPELYESAKRLSDKMIPAWNEPSVERGSFIGGFDGLMDKSVELLTEEDKDLIAKYAKSK